MTYDSWYILIGYNLSLSDIAMTLVYTSIFPTQLPKDQIL